MALPGTAAIPAVHADRLRAAEASGRQAVEIARSRLTPSRVIMPGSLRALLAIAVPRKEAAPPGWGELASHSDEDHRDIVPAALLVRRLHEVLGG